MIPSNRYRVTVDIWVYADDEQSAMNSVVHRVSDLLGVRARIPSVEELQSRDNFVEED